jgi:hypothetical protein
MYHHSSQRAVEERLEMTNHDLESDNTGDNPTTAVTGDDFSIDNAFTDFMGAIGGTTSGRGAVSPLRRAGTGHDAHPGDGAAPAGPHKATATRASRLSIWQGHHVGGCGLIVDDLAGSDELFGDLVEPAGQLGIVRAGDRDRHWRCWNLLQAWETYCTGNRASRTVIR